MKTVRRNTHKIGSKKSVYRVKAKFKKLNHILYDGNRDGTKKS